MDASETFRDRSESPSLDFAGESSGASDRATRTVPANAAGRLSPANAAGRLSDTARGSASGINASGINAQSHAAQSHPLLQRLYGPVAGALVEVEHKLRDEMQSPFEDVAPLLRHGVQLGGKRLRPAIHLLLADALGGVQPANVVIGAVLEMVHTATLVHDDVLDGAQTRRHVPTINAQWNNHTSILLGDYLFAQSFRLAATLKDTRTCQWVGEAARRVCEGELRQVLGRDDLEIDEVTYFEIIQGKTAELCRVACSLAAAEAGCTEDEIAQLSIYGDSLGIAFQIADDFLDLWGEDESVGKTLGTDLEQGKITLPVIRLIETSEPTDREQILSILRGPSEERVERIRPWLDQSDARRYTLETAHRFRDSALAAIEGLSPCPAKQCLTEIASFSVERSF